MLQRIQSVFLFLITILSVLQLFLPFQEITTYETSFQLFLFPGKYNESYNGIIHLPLALNAIIIILSLFTVFKYKNRKLQMKLCTFIAILSFMLTASLFLFTYAKLNDTHNTSINYNASSFIPLANIVLAFIAKRFIKSDEDLIKSADRIR